MVTGNSGVLTAPAAAVNFTVPGSAVKVVVAIPLPLVETVAGLNVPAFAPKVTETSGNSSA